MTDPFDIEPILDDWFADDGTDYLPDRSIDAVLGTIRNTSQRRRGWPVPWRSSMMQTSLKFAIGAVAVVAIAFGGWFFLRPAASGGAVSPTPSPSSRPTASPTAAPTAFTSSVFGVPIQLTMLDGWTSAGTQPGSVDLDGPSQPASIMSIASMTVRGAKSSDPLVAWPADIHAWLAKRAEFRPGTPRSITIGGRPATVIDVAVVTPVADTGDWVRCGPVGVSCGINLRAANDGGGWQIHLVVVPTGAGTGIVAYTDAPSDGFDAAVASLDKLLATLEFR